MMRTNPLIPKVDGKRYEMAFQKGGTLAPGHDIPDKNNRGTDVKTNISMTDSLSGTQQAKHKAHKIQAPI